MRRVESWVAAPEGLAAEGDFVLFAGAGFGPGFGFEGEAVEHFLDEQPVVFHAVAIQIGGDVEFRADDGTGAAPGARDGVMVPGG